MAPDVEAAAAAALSKNALVREWCRTMPNDRLFYIAAADGVTHKIPRREMKLLLAKLVLLGKITP